MTETPFQRRQSLQTPPPKTPGEPDFGRRLLARGVISASDLFAARAAQAESAAALPDLLHANGALDITRARALLAEDLDLPRHQNLAATYRSLPVPPDRLLRLNICGARAEDDTTFLVTGRPEKIDELRKVLPNWLRRARIAFATEPEVEAAILGQHIPRLVETAEARVAPEFSSRVHASRFLPVMAALGAVLVAWALVSAKSLLVALTFLALLCVFLTSALKTAALLAALKRPRPPAPNPEPRRKLPRISVLVPLFHETEIAHALVSRLNRLTYPKALLEVVLVLEQADDQTREMLDRCDLPSWMRTITVPDIGDVTTKPRALNYALDFCRGDIIGIWDAEDAPAPDQLEVIAAAFADAADDVACLQGVLDYYNPWTNWLSRCFTIEYAAWFRVILPGLQRLGLVVPLGGTTLFLRRDAIEAVGGWDAHNVTEDADLGVRLARFGYVTELVPTVTHEEANCHLWPWIRQRSRWLKGYMSTWLVHMRSPRRLWRDLGARRFLALQVTFAASLGQFLLAPFVWLFALAVIGLGHPLQEVLGANGLFTLTGLLLLAGVIDIIIAGVALSGTDRRGLYPWVLTLSVYYTLATVAALKALRELAVNPFFWDKTAHGTTAEGRGQTGSAVVFLPQTGDEGR